LEHFPQLRLSVEDVKPEDIASTIYAAIGVDYIRELILKSLKQGFECVPFARDRLHAPVNEQLS
jgi:hypothetical protein